MARFDSIKQTIDANIKINGNQAITGQVLNSVMKDMLSATDAELTELSAVIGGEDREYNSSILVNQGLINSNGTIYPSESAYSYSDSVKVLKGQRISVTVNQTTAVAAATLFDINDKPIRTLIATAYVLSTAETDIEDGVAYVRFCSANNTSSVFKAFIEGSGLVNDLAATNEQVVKLNSSVKQTDKKISEISSIVNSVNSALGKIENDIDDIKENALLASKKILSHNVYDSAKAENGVYYRWNDGVKVERSDIASTGLIACKPNDEVYSFYGNSLYGGNVTFWDKKGNYISGLNATTSPWSVPNNTDIAFFRTSLYNSVINLLCININEKVEADTYREEQGYFANAPIVAPNIEALSESIGEALKPSKVVVSHNVYNPLMAENGLYYQWNTGAKITRSDIASTGLIPCKANDVVYAFRYTANYGGNVTFWDKDGKYVSGFDTSTSPWNVPNDERIAYFRTSFFNSILSSLCININEKFDDDVYREEDAYKSEIPIYAPNLNSEVVDAMVKYYTMTRDCVTSIYGRNNEVGSSFIFSVIAKTNYDGVSILPRVKGTSDTNPLGDANITTVIAYAKKHDYQHTINASIYLVDGNVADGTTIIDKQILKDGACTQFTINQYVLGIKADGTMKAYRDVSAQSILDDGCVDAIMGFVPLVEGGEAVADSVLSICPHGHIRHPRQIIGVLSTGDYFTFFCDGRTDNENGMTLRECINTITSLADVQFAFNLDGGGSSQSVTYHKQINRMLDGRKVPNVIAFVA